ncbi:MAG TPA: MIP/aquaporin family protein [Acidimicrobiales bacterium]|nr:MIP/aquaporin family protein [Acidimicrobiales bacterium]
MLLRRGVAEGLGTFFLVAIVVGSGIAAQRLSPGNVGLELLENSTATGAGLAALIIVFGPISGAHFNPVVTLLSLVDRSLTWVDGAVHVGAQLVGAVAGAVAANLMFQLPAATLSTHTRSAGALWFAEVVATFGLLLVVISLPYAASKAYAPFAVGGYIAAAYWFTSSTSFANPAVTVGRMFTDTFAGIRPSSAPGFVVAQLVGGVLAIVVGRYLFAREPVTT